MALRADVGQPCPNGCTSGYGRDKRPVLIERACDSPGMRDTPEELADFEDDGERWCPQCWDYMGNAQMREQLVAEIEANDWTVEFVEWCEDAETPGFLGQTAGVTIHSRKAIKVKTHDVSEEQIVAVLAHEIEHMRGARHGTDHPELGLRCGGRTNVYGVPKDAAQ